MIDRGGEDGQYLISHVSQACHISIHEIFLSTSLRLDIKFPSNPHENNDVKNLPVCSVCSWVSAGWMLQELAVPENRHFQFGQNDLST